MAVTDGDVIKVVQTIECPALVIAQNVYYWRLDDPTPDSPSNAQIVSAVDTRLDDMYSQIDADMSTEYQASDFTVERIDWDGTKWETQENVGTGDITVVGENAADAVPHGVAATVTANTSRPQTKARKFLTGIVESLVADSTWSGTVLTSLALYIISWLTDQAVVGSAELIPVVVGQSGLSAGSVYPLIAAGANAIAGYQRRRKPGVGV